MSDNTSAAGKAALASDSPDAAFEDVLRPYLPFLPTGEPLTADADLQDMGLDSVGTVELLAALETTYGVRFLDDALKLENFASPNVLWRTLTEMTESDT